MQVDQKTAQQLLCKWQPLLRLGDWDIAVQIVTQPWRKSGDVKIDLDDHKAILLLNEHPRSENLEEVIVHELVHVKLWALDQMIEELLGAVYGKDEGDPRREFAYGQFMIALESTTEELTKALLAAAQSEAPLSFGRLRGEVEKEIGPR